MSSLKSYFFRNSTSFPEPERVPEESEQLAERLYPPLPPVPNIPPSIARNPRALSRELLQGESLPVFVGPEAIKFVLPLAMMQYFCSKLAEIVTFHGGKQHYILQLFDHDETAWGHLVQYMHSGELDKSLGPRVPRSSNVEDVTLLLCKMWLTADFLGFQIARSKILDNLEKVFKLARDQDMATALAPETIIHVWSLLPDDEALQDSYLWNSLMTEMKLAFTSIKERPVFKRYSGCFDIPAFRFEVAGAMTDFINSKTREEPTGPKTSEESSALKEPTYSAKRAPVESANRFRAINDAQEISNSDLKAGF